MGAYFSAAITPDIGSRSYGHFEYQRSNKFLAPAEGKTLTTQEGQLPGQTCLLVRPVFWLGDSSGQATKENAVLQGQYPGQQLLQTGRQTWCGLRSPPQICIINPCACFSYKN